MKKLTAILGLVLIAFLNNSSEINAQGIAGPRGQCETGGPANIYCPYWDVTYEVTQGILGPTIKVTCNTGGEFTCETRKG